MHAKKNNFLARIQDNLSSLLKINLNKCINFEIKHFKLLDRYPKLSMIQNDLDLDLSR